MSDLLKSIVALQVEALSTLKDVTTLRGLQRRLNDMGYSDTMVTEELATALELGSAISDIIETLKTEVIFGRPDLEDIPGLISQITDVVTLIKDFDPNVSLAPFNEPGFAQKFALFLVDDMLRQILRTRFPQINLLLFIVGVIRSDEEMVAGRQQRIERIDLTAFGDFLTDPTGTLNTRFGLTSDFWTGPEAIDFTRHLNAAGLNVLRGQLSEDEVDGVTSINIDAGDFHYDIMLLRSVLLNDLSPLEAGLRLIPKPDQGKMGLGVVLSENITSTTIPLSPQWDLGLAIDPDTDVLVSVSQSGIIPEPISPTIEVSLTAGAQETMLIFGDPDATRLTLDRFEIAGGITFGADSDARLAMALEGLTLTVKPGDGLLAEVMGEGFDTTVDLEIAWSARDGVTFGGSLGFQFTLPGEIALGPITISDMTFEVAARDVGPALTAGADLSADFGPFYATVGGLGAALILEEADDGVGLIGPYDIRVGAKIPDAFGLSVDLPAVKGGGFLNIEGGRYSGALAIDVMSVGISAITVIDTDLPDMPGGYAFFAALALEFPAIPLGFGFTLSGLGGLIALNRGIDTIAIASGLKDGVVDTLLFPDDPVRDAPLLITMIDDYFPLLAGNTVVGPIVQIGWGAPKTLITAQLGIVISVPEGKIALLGSIEVLLPDPAAPLLTLKMDLLGEINLPGGTLFMMASLYDSQLLNTIELSGDMGTFLATKDRPYFLLSVGGYNPGFEPPALVPAPLHDLRRMAASIRIADNVRLTIEVYFAVTSNTVQFGAALELVMTAKIAFKTYTVRGGLEFHIFLRFSPFKIVAEISAHFGVYSGSKELLGVYLGATLEGPKPWFATGRAEFKFFGLKVKFNVEVGSQALPEEKPRVPLRADVLAALRDPASWAEAPPLTGELAGVTFLDPPAPLENEPTPVWVRPDHLIKVSQSVAPLDKTMEVVGQGLPAIGDERLNVTGAGITGVSTAWEIIQDFFAPAQFEQLGKKEKMSRESFEEMNSGVAFGDASPKVTPHIDLCREAPEGYEEQWYDPNEVQLLDMDKLILTDAIAGSVAAQKLNTKVAQPIGQFEIASVAYGVAAVSTGKDLGGTLATGGASQSDALSLNADVGAGLVVSLASLEQAA